METAMASCSIKMRPLIPLLALALAACASNPAATTGGSGWTIEEAAGEGDYKPIHTLTLSDPQSARVRGVYAPEGPATTVFFLERQAGGRWAPSLDADARQPGVEALWLDGNRRVVGLAAIGTASNSAGDGRDVCNMDAAGNRDDLGYYSLCNSEFATQVKDLGLLFAPLRVIPGMDIRALEVDVEKLQQALDSIDLDSIYQAAIQRDQQLTSASRQAANQINRARLDRLASWRNSLSPGDDSVCGIVVEVRPPLAAVQFASEVRWVKIESLFPRDWGRPLPGGVYYCSRI